MGAKDMERQKLNVFRMRLLGAQVRAVTSGTATLKDATSEAIRDWVTNVETTHYILGSAAGPHPYPMMVGTPHCHPLYARFSKFLLYPWEWECSWGPTCNPALTLAFSPMPTPHFALLAVCAFQAPSLPHHGEYPALSAQVSC